MIKNVTNRRVSDFEYIFTTLQLCDALKLEAHKKFEFSLHLLFNIRQSKTSSMFFKIFFYLLILLNILLIFADDDENEMVSISNINTQFCLQYHNRS